VRVAIETVTIKVPGGFGKREKQERKQAAVREIPLNARDDLRARRYDKGDALSALLIFQVIAESLVKALASRSGRHVAHVSSVG